MKNEEAKKEKHLKKTEKKMNLKRLSKKQEESQA